MWALRVYSYESIHCAAIAYIRLFRLNESSKNKKRLTFSQPLKCAQDRTRTYTVLLPLVPETSVSTISPPGRESETRCKGSTIFLNTNFFTKKITQLGVVMDFFGCKKLLFAPWSGFYLYATYFRRLFSSDEPLSTERRWKDFPVAKLYVRRTLKDLPFHC